MLFFKTLNDLLIFYGLADYDLLSQVSLEYGQGDTIELLSSNRVIQAQIDVHRNHDGYYSVITK